MSRYFAGFSIGLLFVSNAMANQPIPPKHASVLEIREVLETFLAGADYFDTVQKIEKLENQLYTVEFTKGSFSPEECKANTYKIKYDVTHPSDRPLPHVEISAELALANQECKR